MSGGRRTRLLLLLITHRQTESLNDRGKKVRINQWNHFFGLRKFSLSPQETFIARLYTQLSLLVFNILLLLLCENEGENTKNSFLFTLENERMKEWGIKHTSRTKRTNERICQLCVQMWVSSLKQESPYGKKTGCSFEKEDKRLTLQHNCSRYLQRSGSFKSKTDIIKREEVRGVERLTIFWDRVPPKGIRRVNYQNKLTITSTKLEF